MYLLEYKRIIEFDKSYTIINFYHNIDLYERNDSTIECNNVIRLFFFTIYSSQLYLFW